MNLVRVFKKVKYGAEIKKGPLPLPLQRHRSSLTSPGRDVVEQGGSELPSKRLLSLHHAGEIRIALGVAIVFTQYFQLDPPLQSETWRRRRVDRFPGRRIPSRALEIGPRDPQGGRSTTQTRMKGYPEAPTHGAHHF